ncbi:MAG: hypothetical protein IJ558_14120 [Treponema sp.]|nr:hypothetical protein [Treponema sp.]MBR1405297.1 hypothetical protein [Treponema sp.]
MRKIFCSVVFLAFFSWGLTFAQENESLVIEVSLDQTSLSSLDSDVKNFTNAAYSQFIKGLTMVSQISVHTAETDNELRKIQKRSQIEAASGLGSEDAAYATDKGSRAKLALSFKVSPVGANYQFSCMISDIETRDTFTSATKKLPIAEVASDAVVDLFAYDVLFLLQKRKYIPQISLDVTNQLKHQEDSIENFQKYVDDYAKQREEAERALSELRSTKLSAEDQIAAENEERALQLKIEMAEKNRQIAEENLRRQQDELLVRAQRQKDLESYSKGQRDKFQKDIEAIEKARAAIRKEVVSNLSLKKRIELIEAAKVNLARLEQQLKDSIAENKEYYDAQMNEEIDRKNAEEWRKADLAGGVPTEAAKNIRKRQIDEIRSKYDALKQSVETDLKASAQPGLSSYREQISSNIADMEKTTYVFRSIDVTDDYLHLKVNEYNGNLSAWEVDSDFDLSSIPKVDTSAVILPQFKLSYVTMTKKSIPKENDKNYEKKYQEYQDTVDMADLYFRTSVPYIYSQIAIKVAYHSSSDTYIVTPVSFSIFRT